MTTSTFNPPFARLIALAAVALGTSLGGCIGHDSVEPIDGVYTFSDPNSWNVREVARLALRWTVNRYPPVADPEIGKEYDVPFAINLPPGTSRWYYVQMAEEVSPHASPLTPETENLPIYHVGRIWIRADEAKVDIFRPLVSMKPGSNPRSPAVYQPITITLRGSFRPWHVTAHQIMTIGVLHPPANNYLPDLPAPRPPAPADDRSDEDAAKTPPSPGPEMDAPGEPGDTPAATPTVPLPDTAEPQEGPKVVPAKPESDPQV